MYWPVSDLAKINTFLIDMVAPVPQRHKRSLAQCTVRCLLLRQAGRGYSALGGLYALRARTDIENSSGCITASALGAVAVQGHRESIDSEFRINLQQLEHWTARNLHGCFTDSSILMQPPQELDCQRVSLGTVHAAGIPRQAGGFAAQCASDCLTRELGRVVTWADCG